MDVKFIDKDTNETVLHIPNYQTGGLLSENSEAVCFWCGKQFRISDGHSCRERSDSLSEKIERELKQLKQEIVLSTESE